MIARRSESHKVAVNSCMPFDPVFYINFDDFNSLATVRRGIDYLEKRRVSGTGVTA